MEEELRARAFKERCQERRQTSNIPTDQEPENRLNRIKRQAARAKAERDIRENAMDDQVRMEQHRIERMRADKQEKRDQLAQDTVGISRVREEEKIASSVPRSQCSCTSIRSSIQQQQSRSMAHITSCNNDSRGSDGPGNQATAQEQHKERRTQDVKRSSGKSSVLHKAQQVLRHKLEHATNLFEELSTEKVEIASRYEKERRQVLREIENCAAERLTLQQEMAELTLSLELKKSRAIARAAERRAKLAAGKSLISQLKRQVRADEMARQDNDSEPLKVACLTSSSFSPSVPEFISPVKASDTDGLIAA